MGYTHYWRKRADLSFSDWTCFLKDIQGILAATTIPVAGPRGRGKPRAHFDVVALNGTEANGYETFYFSRLFKPAEWNEPGEDFTFCKTARKPYDEVVTAILLAAAYRFGPALRIESDGYWSEWTAGRALYVRATGREAARPEAVREVAVRPEAG